VTEQSERGSAALGPRLLFTLSVLVIYRLGTSPASIRISWRSCSATAPATSSTRLTVVGVVPEFLRARYGMPPGFDGVELLIVVSVILDFVAQLSAERGRHER
jgi:preprotein translocase subunit SecY